MRCNGEKNWQMFGKSFNGYRVVNVFVNPNIIVHWMFKNPALPLLTISNKVLIFITSWNGLGDNSFSCDVLNYVCKFLRHGNSKHFPRKLVLWPWMWYMTSETTCKYIFSFTLTSCVKTNDTYPKGLSISFPTPLVPSWCNDFFMKYIR